MLLFKTVIYESKLLDFKKNQALFSKFLNSHSLNDHMLIIAFVNNNKNAINQQQNDTSI